MKLLHIGLSNYRNFQHLSVNLGESATIFIGKNGTGKTNLLTAICQALSMPFAKIKNSKQYDFLASSDRKVQGFKADDPTYIYNQETHRGDYKYPIGIFALAIWEGFGLRWSFRKSYENDSLNSKQYLRESQKFWDYHYLTGLELPVFAYFSDTYPHIPYLGKAMKEKLSSGYELPQNTGYYMWDDIKNCPEIWHQYLIMNMKNHIFDSSKNEKSEYVEAIKKTLYDFTKPLDPQIKSNEDFELTDIKLSARYQEDVLIFCFKDGRNLPFQSLPQGYKRLLSIVLDIASRSFFLNHHCNSSGIVLIDEVELHLHPSLAAEVVTRLKRNFQNIQFILSTHSPLVITNFNNNDNNIIYKMHKNEEGEDTITEIPNVYGVDYNTGLRDVMGTPIQNSVIVQLIQTYEYWKSLNTEFAEKAKSQLKQLGYDVEKNLK